jgi:hypothetical protein
MTTPQAPAHYPHQASTRHQLVDERFAGILAEDFGITYVPRCWARRHGRSSYRVPREGPPGRSVDCGDRRQGCGGLRPVGCSLRALVTDTDIVKRIVRHLGVVR